MADISIVLHGEWSEWVVVLAVGGWLWGFFGAMGRDLAQRRRRAR